MSLSGLLVQILNGIASASSIFLVAAGLTLVFGVMRIINFAHGSLYMLGLYSAYSIVSILGNCIGFWPAILIAAVSTGLVGGLVEILLLRRIYRAPELLQLLATFAIGLVIKDAVLWIWGPDVLLGPKAPGMEAAVGLMGRQFPTYDLFLIAIGPLALLVMWVLLKKTHWGAVLRAATQDREMLGALGKNQALVFTSVFILGSFLAGLGGALQLPREPASLDIDLNIIGSAFVVVVVGGMGSIPGAYIACLMVSLAKAICIWIGVVEVAGITASVSKLTLVAEFVVMAIVLSVRPSGLLGRPQEGSKHSQEIEKPIGRMGLAYYVVFAISVALLLSFPLFLGSSYAIVLLIDLLIAVLFATSLHFIAGPAGLHTFGHAAYFGVGAYTAAVLTQRALVPQEIVLVVAPLVAALVAFIYGRVCVRLSGAYLSMLTLAFAQITWAVCHQWDSLTGGSNGLTGIWLTGHLADKKIYFYTVVVLVTASVYLMHRILHAPIGYSLRAARDSPLRCGAIGIDIVIVRWIAFGISGGFAGLSGVLYAFSKGSVSPEMLNVTRSIDGLVMVLLGGIHSTFGPIFGAVSFTWLQGAVARHTEYWRAVLGAIVLMLIVLFPKGLVGIGDIFDHHRLRGTLR